MRLNPLHIVWLLFVLVYCAACTIAQEAPPELPLAREISTAEEPIGDYQLLPGDIIEIKFFYHPELNERITILPDGKISLQLIGEVLAAGLTASQLDEVLTQEYDRYLKYSSINVIVRDYSGLRVFVGGEVGSQGFVSLKGNMTILQSIFARGGFKKTADTETLVLIRKGPGGKPVAMTVDLKPVLGGKHLENDMYLLPADIVYVQPTWVAKAGEFADQVMRRMLFLNPVLAGAGSALGYQWVTNK